MKIVDLLRQNSTLSNGRVIDLLLNPNSTGGGETIINVVGLYDVEYLGEETNLVEYIEQETILVEYLATDELTIEYLGEETNLIEYIEQELIEIESLCQQ